MALGAITPSLTRLIGLALVGVLLLLAGGAADRAQGATPCTKYGEVHADDLRNRQARASIRCFLNRERDQRGIPNLHTDKKLQKAAQKHTEVMLKKDCFSHQCPGEGDLASRLRGVDYLISGLIRWMYGENIAWGGAQLGTPKAMVKAWMNSPGHKANILNPTFRDVGVGFVPGIPGSLSAEGGMYTTDFGLRLLG